MLRLPPSLITLSAVEIQDFSTRQKVRLRGTTTQHSGSYVTTLRPKNPREANKYAQLKSAKISFENNVNDRLHGTQHASGSIEHRADASDSSQYAQQLPEEFTDGIASDNIYRELPSDWYERFTQPQTGFQRGSTSRADEFSGQVGSRQEEYDITGNTVEGSSCEDGDEQSFISQSSNEQENGHQHLPVSHDSTRDIEHYIGQRGQQIHQKPSSPSKHRFDYGGFVESYSHDSSSFVPDDISTPAPLISNDVQRLRARLPLPRSPLHMSELVAKSPERSHADNLSMRVASYGAPSLLLSQPPRRAPKAYRPRTISYSYDESERASAVYEEPQVNVSDNEESQSGQGQPGEQMSLYEELRGSSLQSVSGRSDIPSSPPPGPVIVHNHEANRTIYFSSPSLPGELPPPFSAVPRRTSLVASIPSILSQEGYKSDDSGFVVEDNPSPLAINDAPESNQAETLPGGMLNRIGRILSGRYRLRSPINSPDSNKTSSPTTPRQSIESSDNPSQSSNLTPRRHIQVYDDSLPPTSQPQTPAHLPESRHRSRLHPSFTAPVARHRPNVLNTTPRSAARITDSIIRSNRRAGRRSNSPLGMGGERGEGFRGLYGGQENTDEDLLFEHAARRLWDTGRRISARSRESDGTPERELTIADIRSEHR